MLANRLSGLDVFRGWAILLMVCFHLAYDLNYFHVIDINLHKETFWVYARYLIVSMFLLSVGVSLTLTHHPKVQWHKMYKRTFILVIASLLVSVATYIQFPRTWVYFGVLHFILFSSWVALFFLPYPKLSLFTALFILVGSYFTFLHSHVLFDFLQSPLRLPNHTEDLVIFFPWFTVVLFGVSLVRFNLHQKLFNLPFFSTHNHFNTFFSLSGRHALIIYLLHQPILFGLVMLFYA